MKIKKKIEYTVTILRHQKGASDSLTDGYWGLNSTAKPSLPAHDVKIKHSVGTTNVTWSSSILCNSETGY